MRGVHEGALAAHEGQDAEPEEGPEDDDPVAGHFRPTLAPQAHCLTGLSIGRPRAISISTKQC